MESVIQFKSIPDQIYEYISTSIIEGKIKPGQKLVENDLCNQFGISRAPLRECFRILESEGLIVIHPRKGTFVKDITAKDVEDVFPVRASLESLAARLAIPNINEKDIEVLNSLIMEMEEALTKQDIRLFLRLNIKFHSVFVKASNNQVLEKTLKNLGRGFWQRMVFLYYNSPSGLDVSNNMHKKIVEALRNRDGLSVEKLVHEHLEHGRRELIKSLPLNDLVKEGLTERDNFSDKPPT